jgi:hypothetical protein
MEAHHRGHEDHEAEKARIATNGHYFRETPPQTKEPFQKITCVETWPESSFSRKTAMSENEISDLENQFPPLSGIAFASARERVLESGQSILESENGILFEVFPDGRKIAVKELTPPIPVAPGSIYDLR